MKIQNSCGGNFWKKWVFWKNFRRQNVCSGEILGNVHPCIFPSLFFYSPQSLQGISQPSLNASLLLISFLYIPTYPGTQRSLVSIRDKCWASSNWLSRPALIMFLELSCLESILFMHTPPPSKLPHKVPVTQRNFFIETSLCVHAYLLVYYVCFDPFVNQPSQFLITSFQSWSAGKLRQLSKLSKLYHRLM